MPGMPRAIAIQHLDGLCRHDRRRSEEDIRIEVALQGNLVADAPARFAQINRPVQADGITAASRDGLQPQAAAFGKYDHGNAAVLLFTFQAGNDPL